MVDRSRMPEVGGSYRKVKASKHDHKRPVGSCRAEASDCGCFVLIAADWAHLHEELRVVLESTLDKAQAAGVTNITGVWLQQHIWLLRSSSCTARDGGRRASLCPLPCVSGHSSRYLGAKQAHSVCSRHKCYVLCRSVVAPYPTLLLWYSVCVCGYIVCVCVCVCMGQIVH
jgi:hypothetical protein